MIYILEHLQSRADSFACALIIFIKSRQKITFPLKKISSSQEDKIIDLFSLYQAQIIKIMTTRPIYYLKQEGYQIDRCCITCFKVDYQMIECKGFCKKLQCKSCFERQLSGNCSTCKYQTAKQYVFLDNPLYLCPSKTPQKCKAQITSIKQLDQHALTCQYVQPETKNQFQLKKLFRCKSNHPLSFKHRRRLCSQCFLFKQSNFCETCSEAYCTQCRPMPCSKKQCPIGHQLRLLKDNGGITCDICGIAVRRFIQRNVFTDRACNFDICAGCAKDLPEDHPLPLYKQARIIQREDDRQE